MALLKLSSFGAFSRNITYLKYLLKICLLFPVKSVEKNFILNQIGSKEGMENTVLASVSIKPKEKGISLVATGVVKQFGDSHIF
ncbi:hypothetical protein COW86_04755 [Candidatus Kuenenbacteria bacterium CG22_combo_CG10-13_8_21_14_all_39_9]|uniref:Uncharacterized protein n=1 Tax=Candidatus Kuenenbacteria bacterium CG22_combo_CG10-13_8_21_14_all_39_9 TaxID=1974621 RepID=A0A2H0CZD6_9BACT|nr:MAG: hypothetical protein COW86_04755 [Candidatus Kuenenbacteria bacterium CG22_combo_CG10-13_8_21_14_all_39_9]